MKVRDINILRTMKVYYTVKNLFQKNNTFNPNNLAFCAFLQKKIHVPKISTLGFNVVIVYCFKISFKNP